MACGKDGADTTARSSRVRASWQPPAGGSCQAQLEIYVKAANGAKVSAGSASAEVGATGSARLVVPEADVKGPNLPIAIAEGGATRTVQLEVPGEPHPKGTHMALQKTGDRQDWAGEVTVESGGRKGAPATRWAAMDEAGSLALPLPCGVTGGKSAHGEVVTDGGQPRLVVDASAGLLDATQVEEQESVIEVDATLDDGKPAKVVMKGKIGIAAMTRSLRQAAQKGADWAPAYAKGKRQPVLIVYDNAVDTKLLGGAKLRDAAAIALVATRPVAAGECGPYRVKGQTGSSKIPRSRSDAVVTVLEARTGKELGEKTIEGREGECPPIVEHKAIEYPRIVGPLPETAVRKWVRKTVP